MGWVSWVRVNIFLLFFSPPPLPRPPCLGHKTTHLHNPIVRDVPPIYYNKSQNKRAGFGFAFDFIGRRSWEPAVAFHSCFQGREKKGLYTLIINHCWKEELSYHKSATHSTKKGRRKRTIPSRGHLIRSVLFSLGPLQPVKVPQPLRVI